MEFSGALPSEPEYAGLLPTRSGAHLPVICYRTDADLCVIQELLGYKSISSH
jgi:hypothetical protein